MYCCWAAKMHLVYAICNVRFRLFDQSYDGPVQQIWLQFPRTRLYKTEKEYTVNIILTNSKWHLYISITHFPPYTYNAGSLFYNREYSFEFC